MAKIWKHVGAKALASLMVLGLLVGAALFMMTDPVRDQRGVSSSPTARPVVPFFGDWAQSSHANSGAESFTHWNKAGAIPKQCAKCHSDFGFRDFVGADGSAAGIVDHPAVPGSVVTCTTCHNEKTMRLAAITFPSGTKVKVTGRSDRCMLCHQGRESTPSVNRAVGALAPDAVSKNLKFINVHYRAAGATLLGTRVKGAYEYAGKTYLGRNKHRKGFNECSGCHDPHRLDVRVTECATCHKEVASKADLRNIRETETDFDGNGDTGEGISREISSLHKVLYAALRAYSTKVAGSPIAYAAHKYPYFFNDHDRDGIASETEQKFGNAYKSWTPRLLKAAYNYQYVAKDPGAYAHNPLYVIQILHDSIADIRQRVDLSTSNFKRP